MMTIKAHFDGKVFVPDEPVNLPPNQRVVFYVEVVNAEGVSGSPPAEESLAPQQSVLDWIAANPVNDPSLPTDLAHQHDHYLYGTPKKP
jgi:hypothetical protein